MNDCALRDIWTGDECNKYQSINTEWTNYTYDWNILMMSKNMKDFIYELSFDEFILKITIDQETKTIYEVYEEYVKDDIYDENWR